MSDYGHVRAAVDRRDTASILEALDGLEHPGLRHSAWELITRAGLRGAVKREAARRWLLSAGDMTEHEERALSWAIAQTHGWAAIPSWGALLEITHDAVVWGTSTSGGKVPRGAREDRYTRRALADDASRVGAWRETDDGLNKWWPHGDDEPPPTTAGTAMATLTWGQFFVLALGHAHDHFGTPALADLDTSTWEAFCASYIEAGHTIDRIEREEVGGWASHFRLEGGALVWTTFSERTEIVVHSEAVVITRPTHAPYEPDRPLDGLRVLAHHGARAPAWAHAGALHSILLDFPRALRACAHDVLPWLSARLTRLEVEAWRQTVHVWRAWEDGDQGAGYHWELGAYASEAVHECEPLGPRT